MVTNECKTLIIFILTFLLLFTNLIFCSALYSINYFRVIFPNIILSDIFTRKIEMNVFYVSVSTDVI